MIDGGAVGIVKPSPTKGRADTPLPSALHGVFLGYRFAPGGACNGEYSVVSLECFADVDFSYDAVGHSKILAPRVTKQVRLPRGGELTYPLTAYFDNVSSRWKG